MYVVSLTLLPVTDGMAVRKLNVYKEVGGEGVGGERERVRERERERGREREGREREKERDGGRKEREQVGRGEGSESYSTLYCTVSVFIVLSTNLILLYLVSL